MLGSRFLEELKNDPEVTLIAFDRSDLDVTDYEGLDRAIESSKPDILINCTAYTDVDGAETNRDLAMKINGEAVEMMAKICKRYDVIFLHFSTDYVFDGMSSDGYTEIAERNPLNVYGKSKAMGEVAIQNELDRYYIVRTSWLYGENGKNFVSTMLKLAETRTELDIVDDQVGSPTYVKDLCQAVIENFLRNSPAFGVYHLTNEGKCSWFDFAAEIFSIANKNVKLNRITTEKLNRPAVRPKFSMLINTKVPRLRSWQSAINDFLLPKREF